MTISEAVEIAKANKLCFSDHNSSQISPDSLLKLYRGHNSLPNYIHFVSCESEVNAAMIGAEKNMRNSLADFSEAVRLSQEFGLHRPERLFFRREKIVEFLAWLIDNAKYISDEKREGYNRAAEDAATYFEVRMSEINENHVCGVTRGPG